MIAENVTYREIMIFFNLKTRAAKSKLLRLRKKLNISGAQILSVQQFCNYYGVTEDSYRKKVAPFQQ